jgi:hypothetical protein
MLVWVNVGGATSNAVRFCISNGVGRRCRQKSPDDTRTIKLGKGFALDIPPASANQLITSGVHRV